MGSRVVSIARALLGAGRQPATDDQIARAARARVADGPVVDSLVCLSLGGDSAWLSGEDAAPVRARIDLLIWEAGATAIAIPELGAWLWNDPAARRMLFYDRAQRTLRERSLAARLLAVSADGLPLQGVTRRSALDITRVANDLASHPEPSVWIPAVRGLGRLASRLPSVRFQLLRWIDSDRAWERRRAVTALACAPGPDNNWIEDRFQDVFDSDDRWLRAALGPAAPILVRERPRLWDRIADRLVLEPGPELAWSLTQGLLAVVRDGELDERTAQLLRAARDRSLSERPSSVTDAQLWEMVRRDTDFLDRIDPDPAFPDVLLDRLVGDAVRVGVDRVQQRASSIARSIGASFDAMLHAAGTSSSAADRGHALVAVESCTRAAALGLWQPVFAAAGASAASVDGGLRVVRDHMGSVLAGYLEQDELDFALRRTALRGLGNLVDATASDEPRGRVAAFALSALAGSKWAHSPGRGPVKRFRKPVTDLLWRVSDALRGLDQADDGDSALGRLAAWWVLSVGGIEFLSLLHHESPEVQQQITDGVDRVRGALGSALAGASVVSWSRDVLRGLDSLGASRSALVRAMKLLVVALDSAEYALKAELHDELSYVLDAIAEPTAILAALRRDPSLALAPASADVPGVDDTTFLAAAKQSIETGEPSAEAAAGAWASRLGPLLRPVVSQTVRRVIELRRTRVAAAQRKDRIGPYKKLRRLGSGGHAEVWLAKREGKRRYVVKTPLGPAGWSEAQRDELKVLLAREASLLEGLHEAKLATFYDYGWDGDTPYLALQYLIGADLYRYSCARLLSIEELKPIVRDVCLGLRALRDRDISHRDLKPSNVFLRLHLPASAHEEFDAVHRDPAVAPISEAVLIDFGIARRLAEGQRRDEPEGTLGYLSPEQAEASEEITSKSDVYGLAGTVFTALTGRRFFEDKPNKTAYLIAHAFERPLADRAVRRALEPFSNALRSVLDDATEADPTERLGIDAFADRFARL